GHPRRRLQTSSVGAVAYDLIPRDSLVRQLYAWDGLLNFLAAALGKDRLYRYADPLGALNIAAMGAEEHLLWHFDQTDFVVSILLPDCERGGTFEYVLNIRDAAAENYDRVWRLLDGDRSEILRLDMAPGTLALFMGRHSIHRVTPIAGPTLRLIALLGYDTDPGTMSSERLKLARYGRTEPIDAVP
ncbi:MAG TPA: 2OG-Fe(II) oxygenase, partial [Stellaceae bacterium]|nr:2OG-Fe(II) oxygenase [Stellaceae bacterium]